MVDGGVELSREAYAQALEARDAGVTYEARPKSDPGGAGKGGARSEVVRQVSVVCTALVWIEQGIR